MSHDDAHGDHHDDGHVPLYCRPVQRQKWGEAQVQPHSNWGDTFFDLFYVAGAYNLGNLLRTEPTSRGILYFVGCFYPLQVVWNQKMYYDARFWNPEDAYHRLYEFAILVVLGTAVLYIRPVEILSDPKNHIDMFVFSLAVALATLMAIGRSVEVYFKGVGQPAMKNASVRDMMWTSAIMIWYVAAAIVSGMEYYGNQDSSSYEKSDTYDDSEYAYDNSTSYEDDKTRLLAGSSEAKSDSYDVYENNTPMGLVVAGSMTFVVGMSLMVLLLPGGGKHKEISVPMNVTFATHRWGEFTMLMLGESVLSLLIVDVTELAGYYKTFFSGIISITLLEYLHFRSQPHEADDHAFRRSKEAGVTFSLLMQIYCAALVVLGTSYKMLLYEFVYEAKERGSYRLLTSSFSRFLAGSDEPMFEEEERRQRVARFFCISMAIVWLCSDLMIINHRGLHDNLGRCRFSHTGSQKALGLTLFAMRVGLVVFIATLGEYTTAPSVLAFVGLLGILAQVALRVVGSTYFGPEFSHDEVSGPQSSALWPNVTQAQVEEDNLEK